MSRPMLLISFSEASTLTSNLAIETRSETYAPKIALKFAANNPKIQFVTLLSKQLLLD